MTRIALVTVTFNGSEVWPEFYSSLAAQRDVDWHLIVVDNASTDGSAALVNAVADPRITLLANVTNRGVAAGNNQGTRRALDLGFELVALINNDTAFGPDLLSRLARTLAEQQSDIGAVSPLIAFYDRPDLSWYAGGHYSRVRGMLSLHDGQGQPLVRAIAPFRTDYAPTCCVLFRANVFETVGLMDEAYFVYWDDVDFLWRMRAKGIGVVVDPRAVLLHKVSVSTGGRLSDFSISYGHRNQIYFARKHLGRGFAGYVSALTATVGLARVALLGDTWRQFRLRLSAVGAGWRMSPARLTPVSPSGQQ